MTTCGGAAVGHVLAAADDTGADGGRRSAMADGVADGVADELVDAVSASEPHAASVMTNDAAQVTSVTEEGRRSEFTAVRIQPHWIPTDGRPSVMFGCRPPGANPRRNDTDRVV